MKIKTCGLFREEDINYANKLKPNYIGFVFAESKRKVKFEEACNLKNKLDKEIKAVGVFVNDNFDFILNLIKDKIIDIIQLHGSEDNDFIDNLKIKTNSKIIINNCALEPEIDDLINFLNECGCDICREKESIVINKCSKLHGCEYKVMSDRIEAGTFLIIGAVLGNNLKINNVNPEHLKSLIDVLEEIGVDLQIKKESIVVNKGNEYKSTNVIVNPYPGFPTDLQQPLSVLLCLCDGVSTIKETIYPARLSHVDSLNEMGASISIKDDLIEIEGNKKFYGKSVSGKDLRGGISLVIAALLASKESKIDGVKYIKRGYSDLVKKLKKIGANVELERVNDDEKETC